MRARKDVGSSGQPHISWVMGTGRAAGNKGNPLLQTAPCTNLGILLIKQLAQDVQEKSGRGMVLPKEMHSTANFLSEQPYTS